MTEGGPAIVPYWTDGKVSVPVPLALTTVDYDRHEINAYVLVLGAEADPHLRALHRKTSAPDATGFINVAGPDEPSFTYLPLTLGDIRGYSPKFHLYGFGAHPRLAADVGRVAGSVAGIIVAQGHSGDIGNVMLAARTVASSGRRVPVALRSDDQLARDWGSASGTPPIFQAPSSEDGFSSALKAVSKEILSSLRNSAAPAASPPPVVPKPWWRVW